MGKKKTFNPPPKKALTPQKPGRDYHLIFLWIIILIVSIIRYRLIGVPFERDEGEYGYIGGLFLHGIAPFKDAYSMKLPGTAFMYAILMLVFGHTNTGIHLGLVFINAATMYFFYAAFKKLLTPFIGLAASSIYGFMAIGIVFDGFASHATYFICFYSSIALLFLAHFLKSGKILHVFLCGLMLGMAFLMKQQAVFLVFFVALFLFIYLKTEKKQGFWEIIKKLLAVGAGVVIPYAAVVLMVILAGQFSIFWLWTVEYASKYENETGRNLDTIIGVLRGTFLPAWQEFSYLWLLALAGILVLHWSPYNRLQKLFVLFYFIASVCVVSAGFYFRPHYFIAVLPALGLLCGIFIEFVIKQTAKKVNILKSPNAALVVLLVILSLNMYSNRFYYFKYPPKEICDMAYGNGTDTFNEAQEISKYIHDNTNDTDKIAVLGSEPEIYFYSGRRAATGYLYTYPLVENQPYNEIMQQEMIKEIEHSKPVFLLFYSVPYSWEVQAGAPQTIFQWINKYMYENYLPVGFADLYSNNGTAGWNIYWNENIKNRSGQPQSSVIICKRKDLMNTKL